MIDHSSSSTLAEGYRVASATRPEFPIGTVLKVMELGYVLVRWDGDVLETAHQRELIRIDAEA